MEQAMYDHFSRVFGTAVHSGMTLNFDSLAVPLLSLEELDANITEDETTRAIQELPADRAPGPDGFTGAFYKASWTAIRVEVMEAIEAFNSGDHRGLERLNNALIVLLPKKVGASCPTDFRPITMIHSFAKLISKILALRLAPRMDELVDKNQNAFIRNRTIQDNFKYVQRAAVMIRKKKTLMLLLKLDISKAFDTLSWPFLIELMQARGFGS
jgi:hypothetical protein